MERTKLSARASTYYQNLPALATALQVVRQEIATAGSGSERDAVMQVNTAADLTECRHG
jgi:hypothetical protein